MRRLTLDFIKDPVWSKVAVLTTILFFVLLADAILSDWVPVYLQNVLGGAFLMGIVVSFSSVAGLAADLIFPQLLRGTAVRKLLVAAILAGLIFSGLLYFSTFRPVLLTFLAAMAVWGIYYEFLGFANQQFVAETAPVQQRASVWAIIGVVKNLAYFLGPIIGSLLAVRGDRSVILVAGGISVIAYLLVFLLRLNNRPMGIGVEEISLVKEIGHWWTLFVHVWPMLTASFALGLVDATFWTTGTVFTEMLATKNWWGGWFLPMYMLPSLFIGLGVMRWGIYQGKKKWAERFMLAGGLVLMLLFFHDSVFFDLAVVFVSSALLSASYPLIEAVYSDIVSRMGRERKHLMGLSASMISLAYIVGPVTAGWVSSRVGERFTFVSVGGMLAIVSVILLMTTPRKLTLPQKEISTWG